MFLFSGAWGSLALHSYAGAQTEADSVIFKSLDINIDIYSEEGEEKRQ